MSQKSTQSAKRSSFRDRRNRPPTAVIVVVAILVSLVGLVVYAIYEATRPPRPIEGAEQFFNLERGHVEEAVTYEQTPPVGGVHNPAWQNCGVYTEPIPSENAVHSLEHGAVWITYQPDLPAAELQKLQSLTRQSGYRLLSPYPGLPSPVVLSAWGYQLKLERTDDSRLGQFIEKYELNPNGPEPGAACTGGVGQPQ